MKIADYNNSIVNLSNSILKKFNVNPFHSTIKEIDDLIKNKDKIIVFLFDGMGKAILEKHLNEKIPLPQLHLQLWRRQLGF